MKPPGPEPWTEERLALLEPQEHDFQEFKSTPYVWDAVGERVRSDFLDNLSKQVSAFANGAGGNIFLGVDDGGRCDAGVPIDLRPNGTREWLEDVIPHLVDPPLRAFNVYEVPGGGGPQSRIAPGRAVYVLEVPTSEDAPHMARDRRYYLRIAGKSRPMSHRHVLDILHRSQVPDVIVERVDPYGDPELMRSDPRGPKVLLCLRAILHNRGRALAQHVGCEFGLPRFAVDSESRRRTLEKLEGRVLQSPGRIRFFFYHPIPLFPTQRLPFGEVWLSIHSANLQHYLEGNVVLRWCVYADEAPRREGSLDVATYSAVQRGIRQVREALKAARR